jgi:hypothetical protein
MMSGGQLRIEVAGRFICQQQDRLYHDRTRDTHTLLLTSRQRSRQSALARQQSDTIQRGADTPSNLRPGSTRHNQRQRQIFEDAAIQ